MTNAAALAAASSLNPFAVHGLEHLSPSTLGKFASSPAMFVLDKLLKRKTAVGAAAHRGTAVEDGLTHGLVNGATDAECVAVAQKRFAELTAMCVDPRMEKEAKGIEPMTIQALKELRVYGKPSGTQVKVSVDVPTLAVPIIGYIDYDWAHHDILLDLKTTWACPSQISLSHARQVSLYQKATGRKSARVSYNTDKKSGTYGLENGEAHFQALVRIGESLQRFLAVSSDPMELAGLVAPDVDHFYFNDPLARQHAFEVWGV